MLGAGPTRRGQHRTRPPKPHIVFVGTASVVFAADLQGDYVVDVYHSVCSFLHVVACYQSFFVRVELKPSAGEVFCYACACCHHSDLAGGTALYGNGKEVGKDKYSSSVEQYDLATYLHKGSNTITVSGSHYWAGHGGILAELTVKLSNGQEVVVMTDGSWVCTKEKIDTWPNVTDASESPWHQVRVVAPVGSGEQSLNMTLKRPEGKAVASEIQRNSAGGVGLVVNNAKDGSLIKAINDNIERDFVSSVKPVHVLHRRIGKTNLYLVHNPTDKPVKTEARFMAKGK